MTLTELKYIVALARERHFGRAAAACFVSQPTLSVAIRKLEDELGVTLFERSPTDVSLTAMGARIVAQAQRVLEEAEQLKRLAEQGADPYAEPLRVGAIYTIGPYLFPQLIPALHQREPRLKLLIEESYTAVLSERLKRGELDVIVIALPYEEPGIVTSPLYDEPFLVAMSSQHPWCERRTVNGEQLAHENLFLLGAGHCFRDQVLEAFPQLSTRNAGDLQLTLEGSSLETIRYMVSMGAGVTVLPSGAARDTAGGLIEYRPFELPVPQRRVALAWRKSFPRVEVIQLLKEAVLANVPQGAHKAA